MKTIVVYDNNSMYNDKIAKIASKVDDIKLVDYNNKEIQEFLDIQFGFKPNCLYVIDDGELYIGEKATNYLINRQGVPSIFSNIVRSKFDDVSNLFSYITDDVSDDIHGVFPIREEAQEFISNSEIFNDNVVNIPINDKNKQ